MTKTNFEKLIRWDADYYNELTDDDCIVCLTEREVYLVGQITDALKWKNTRWIGDILGLDFDLIASNLEYKLAERMTCQNIGDLLQKITQLEQKLNVIYNDTVTDNGGTIPDENTRANEVHDAADMAENFSVAMDACEVADKDELYAGIAQFVRYVNQMNIDALQNIAQAGNVADQAARLVSGTPIIGLLPFDEIIDYVEFLMDELLDEYEATVDEELLQQVTCDLFCIAVNSNCVFNLSDAINHYGSKLGSTALDLFSSLANVVQFAATGTFSGDEYFYFMSVFQFITVAISDEFFGIHGMDNYMLQFAAGANSPDNDWTLFCDDCPLMYRVMTYNFEYGEQGWELENLGVASTKGVWSGNRWEGTITQFSEKNCQITRPHDPAHRIHAVKLYKSRSGGIASGDKETSSITIRPTANSATGQTVISAGGFEDNGDTVRCVDQISSGSYWTGINEIAVGAQVRDVEGSTIYITQVDVVYMINHAPVGAVITLDANICD